LPVLLFLQLSFQWVELRPLAGHSTFVARPVFSWERWFDGQFQQESDQYLNQHIGLRELFIRIRNQLFYSAFEEPSAQQVVVGKNDVLFEQNYIDAYLGQDYVGKDSVENQLKRIRLLQDTLAAQNIRFVMVLAAGKASFFSEHIPDRFFSRTKGISNYEAFSDGFNRYGIHHIDFNRWFLQMKDTSNYPLYPKYGIHWSRYGELLVADSLINYLSQATSRALSRYATKAITWSTTPAYTDNDIGDGMNLLFDLPPCSLAYPTVSLQPIDTSNRPNVLVIGDSYYWGLFNLGLSADVFNNSPFWYYNKEIHYSDGRQVKTTGSADLRATVEQQDAVVIICTEASLKRFGFGFISSLYNSYFEPEQFAQELKAYQERITFWINTIKGNEAWVSSAKERAALKGWTLDETIQADAEFMVAKELEEAQ
jgi:hypothetical protein